MKKKGYKISTHYVFFFLHFITFIGSGCGRVRTEPFLPPRNVIKYKINVMTFISIILILHIIFVGSGCGRLRTEPVMPPRYGRKGDGAGLRAEPGTRIQYLQMGQGGHKNPLLRETHPKRHRYRPNRSSCQRRFV